MLTIETLKQNTALAGLSEEQLSAIAEMSRNDENAVIGTRIGALHGQYDADILGITGMKKKEGEKSYDYAKRVLGEYKTKADTAKTLQAELTAAKAKVTELESKGADAAVLQQLNDAKARVTQLQTQLSTKETEFTTEKSKLEAAIKATHVDYAFQMATSGLKFKDGITEPIQKTLLGAAKAEILAKGTPDFIDDGQGGKRLVLRNAEGNILNNPKNNLNPYTIKELVLESSLKDVIAEDRKVTGGGTGPDNGGKGGGNTLDLSGVKTQMEADRLIESHLLANGLTRDSQEFSEQSLQLRADNNVSSLPIR